MSDWTDKLDNILVWAFPASGKSETFSFIEGLTDEQRAKLHLGKFRSMDDYPLVASLIRVDDAFEAAGNERQYTRKGTYDTGGFKSPKIWDVLDKFLASEYQSMLDREGDVHKDHSVLIECARGGSLTEALKGNFPLRHGYWNTLKNLPDSLLSWAVIFYVQVSPETSRRKNDARYDPNDPLGTLGHRVPTQVMHEDYGCDDILWMMEQAKKQGREGYVQSPSGLWIPIGILDNETEDLTSFVRQKDISDVDRQYFSEKLYEALEKVLPPLFERYRETREER